MGVCARRAGRLGTARARPPGNRSLTGTAQPSRRATGGSARTPFPDRNCCPAMRPFRPSWTRWIRQRTERVWSGWSPRSSAGLCRGHPSQIVGLNSGDSLPEPTTAHWTEPPGRSRGAGSLLLGQHVRVLLFHSLARLLAGPVPNHPGEDHAGRRPTSPHPRRSTRSSPGPRGSSRRSAQYSNSPRVKSRKPIRFSANGCAWVESASGSPTAAPSSPMSSRSSTIDSALWACEGHPHRPSPTHAADQEHLGNPSHNASSPSARVTNARSLSGRHWETARWCSRTDTLL